MARPKKVGGVYPRYDKAGNIRGWVAEAYNPATGRGQYVGMRKTQGEAAQLKIDADAKFASGEEFVPKQKRDDVTLEEWIENWKRRKLPNLAYHTRSDYENSCKHILAFFGDRTLASIKLEDCELFATWLKERVKGKPRFSPNSANKHYVRLSQILKDAVRHKKLKDNPATDVEDRPQQKPTKKPVPLEQDQVAKMLDVVDKEFPHYSTLFFLWSMLGLRRGEMLGLLWENVDFKKKEIRVRTELTYVKTEEGRHQYVLDEDLKTENAKREIPLDDVALILLKRLRVESFGRPKNKYGWDLVFTTPSGSPIHPSNFHRDVISKVQEKSGIDFSTHTFRHTLASLLNSRGHTMKEIQELLGHADYRLTADLYTHLFKEQNKKAAASAGGWMSEVQQLRKQAK